MKIIAVEQNYINHNEKSDCEQPLAPLVFLKPDSAILKNNKPFYIPAFTQELHYEAELIVRINRLGKNISSRFAHRYYSEIGLGIDFTAHDLQQKLKAAGEPWDLSKAFDSSAVIGDFVPVAELGDVRNIPFRLDIDKKTVQEGNSADMIFSINEIIAYVSRFFTLKIGDVIFTGTPAGASSVAIGNKLEGYIFDKKVFDFNVK